MAGYYGFGMSPITQNVQKNLGAFHGKQSVKDFYLRQVSLHEQAGHIAQGAYYDICGDVVRACAVGCIAETDNNPHRTMSKKLALPEWLCYVEDSVFEGLPKSHFKTFPRRFIEAIPVGADTNKILHQFFHWLLVDERNGVLKAVDAKKYPSVREAILAIAELHKKVIDGLLESPFINPAAWTAARTAAWTAAETAAETAAWTAAETAARTAAWTAAETAARTAAWTAAETAAWTAAETAAEENAYIAISEKLLELLRNAPLVA